MTQTNASSQTADGDLTNLTQLVANAQAASLAGDHDKADEFVVSIAEAKADFLRTWC